MAKYSVSLPDAAAARLQALVARYNADNGAALSVTEWLALHLKELAIGDDLTRQWEALQAQNRRHLEAAAAGLRERLLAALEGGNA
jgi:hypothetical protein